MKILTIYKSAQTKETRMIAAHDSGALAIVVYSSFYPFLLSLRFLCNMDYS